ncbi:MAG: hypothetical protein ACRDFC_05375, partial [Ignavibacteria bacterium]
SYILPEVTDSLTLNQWYYYVKDKKGNILYHKYNQFANNLCILIDTVSRNPEGHYQNHLACAIHAIGDTELKRFIKSYQPGLIEC